MQQQQTNGFMTLQHPKTQLRHINKQLNFSQDESPFMPAPVIYSPPSSLVIKQGYMTLPRKPRVPSWTPVSATSSIASTTRQQQPHNKFHQMPYSPNSSETSSTANLEFLMEPVYDNLGVRTTAAGNSTLNLNKSNADTIVRYSMRHRPLPATPNVVVDGNDGNNKPQQHINGNDDDTIMPIYVSSNQQQQKQQQQQQSSSSSFINDYNNSMNINKGDVLTKSSKTPPQPPPKPKKKILSLTSSIKAQRNAITTPTPITTTTTTNNSQVFDDEGDDGTEV